MKFNNLIFQKGTFNFGKKVGIWEYYSLDSRLYYKFDFDSMKVVEYNWLVGHQMYNILLGEEWVSAEIDSPPILLDIDINIFIAKNIRYPIEAQMKKVTGKLILAVNIEKNGNVKNIRIHTGSDKLLEEEAIRVLNLAGNFYPAIYKGNPVECEIFIPIKFNNLGNINRH